ncbi:MAG TPA: hypothetical protein VIL20_25715 [Sandaracinaceae bacterium]
MRSIVTGIVITLLGSTSALAQEADGEARAREIFERGRDAYNRELFTEAEDAFLAAYEAMPPDNPRRLLILLNVAQAIERQGGRDRDALAAWERFRTEAAEVAAPELLQRADERIRELRRRAERRESDAGREADEPPAPAPPPARGFEPHWSGIALTALGGAAALAGAIVGIAGLVERGEVLALCTGTVCPIEVRDRAAQLETYGVAADALLWPGLGIAAVGVVLMLILPASEGETATTASCGPGGCALGWRW